MESELGSSKLVDDPCIKIQLQTAYRIYIHIFYRGAPRAARSAARGRSAIAKEMW